MSDQYNDSLGVCNVKIRKSLTGAKRDTFLRCFGLQALLSRDSNFFCGIDADLKSSCCEHILANT